MAGAAVALVAVLAVVRPLDRPLPVQEAPRLEAQSPAGTTEARQPRPGREGSPESEVASTILGGLKGAGPLPQRPRAEWIGLLNDAGQPVPLRRQAAKALALEGSLAAFAALSQALTNGSQELRGHIAEALGKCPRPEAGPLLNSLLQAADESTARGAVRGVAARDPVEALESLRQLLYDDGGPVSVRTEAALALSKLPQPGTLDLLMAAATELRNEKVIAQVLQGIGERPFTETEGFFSTYLDSATTSTTLRVAALEAVGQAKGDPGRFLLTFASDPTPETRAAAAWAMSTTETRGSYGTPLSEILAQEQHPEVRLRLYQALGNQESFDAQIVAAAIQRETDSPARLAGYTLVAGTLGGESAWEFRSYFDRVAVPELKEAALNSPARYDRLASVIALQKARTSEAVRALQELAQTSADPKVASAASAALSRPRR